MDRDDRFTPRYWKNTISEQPTDPKIDWSTIRKNSAIVGRGADISRMISANASDTKWQLVVVCILFVLHTTVTTMMLPKSPTTKITVTKKQPIVLYNGL